MVSPQSQRTFQVVVFYNSLTFALVGLYNYFVFHRRDSDIDKSRRFTLDIAISTLIREIRNYRLKIRCHSPEQLGGALKINYSECSVIVRNLLFLILEIHNSFNSKNFNEFRVSPKVTFSQPPFFQWTWNRSTRRALKDRLRRLHIPIAC